MSNREEIEKMLADGKSHRAIAEELSISRGTVSDHASRIKAKLFGPIPGFEVTSVSTTYNKDGDVRAQSEKAVLYPPAQEPQKLVDGLYPVPPDFYAERATTLYGRDGKVDKQWVKSKVDDSKRKIAYAEWMRGLAETLPRAEVFSGPLMLDADLMSTYVIGDAHFGMLAWGEETGTPFDLNIAERELLAAVRHLVSSAPDSKYGLLVDVGDFMHTNSRASVTPHGNLLDSDSRYMKMVRVVIKTFRRMIEMMLCKHEFVKVIIAPGNHNPDSAGWMALTLGLFYENDPRIEVDQHPGSFFYHRFGKCLVGVTHGDTCKMPELGSIMACDQAKHWGETEHRHFLTGHIHHTVQEEFRGVFVESFNTLAPGDAWHKSQGYRAKQQMQRLDFHREHGIYSRASVNPGMIKK